MKPLLRLSIIAAVAGGLLAGLYCSPAWPLHFRIGNMFSGEVRAGSGYVINRTDSSMHVMFHSTGVDLPREDDWIKVGNDLPSGKASSLRHYLTYIYFTKGSFQPDRSWGKRRCVVWSDVIEADLLPGGE